MPCMRGVVSTRDRARSSRSGRRMLLWWKATERKKKLCQITNARGLAPAVSTCSARYGAEIAMSAAWNRSAVLASRSRSTW